MHKTMFGWAASTELKNAKCPATTSAKSRGKTAAVGSVVGFMSVIIAKSFIVFGNRPKLLHWNWRIDLDHERLRKLANLKRERDRNSQYLRSAHATG